MAGGTDEKALFAAGVAADRVYRSGERDMQCAVALCGHCQLGPPLVCRDGPMFGYPTTVARGSALGSFDNA